MFWPWLTSLHYPQTLNSAKLYVLNRLTEAPRDNFKLGGNFSYFTFCFTGNLTMTNFLHYPQLLAVNMFSKVPRGRLQKRLQQSVI